MSDVIKRMKELKELRWSFFVEWRDRLAPKCPNRGVSEFDVSIRKHRQTCSLMKGRFCTYDICPYT